jgi:MYXO-CTERM domain-containing protein
MNRDYLVGVGVVVVCAGGAFAGPASITSVSGVTDAQASADNYISKEFDSDMDHDVTSLFTGFPITSTANATTSISSGHGDGDLDASMMMDATSLTIMANGEAYAEAYGGGTTDTSAFGSSSAEFEVVFTVSGMVDYVLDFYVMVEGVNQIGNAAIVLREDGGSGGSTIHSIMGTPDGVEDIYMGTLAPGSYTLSGYASAAGFADDTTSDSSARGLFDFSFAVTPSPGAVGVMAMGGIVGLRRRRA